MTQPEKSYSEAYQEHPLDVFDEICGAWYDVAIDLAGCSPAAAGEATKDLRDRMEAALEWYAGYVRENG